MVTELRGNAESVEIAPYEDALTFARPFQDGVPTKLLVVSAYEGDMITGVDLSMALGRPVFDPIILYNELGRQAILDALQFIPESAYVTVPTSSLGLPVGLGQHHIGVGANFPAHADEAGVDEGPFLFPKIVYPSGPTAAVSAGAALLDYEVELCYVPLRDFPTLRAPRVLGLILCNDFTDRAKLLRRIDADDIASGQGFTYGKSAAGFLPVGNLFVVPRDTRTFAASLELNLYVNAELRQRALLADAMWDLDTTLVNVDAQRSRKWVFQGSPVGLPFKVTRVPARTLIMSGTPSGTVFDGIRTMHIVRGVLDWLIGGWDRPVQQWVVDRYIEEETKLGRYLAPGDLVSISVHNMGEVKTLIAD